MNKSIRRHKFKRIKTRKNKRHKKHSNTKLRLRGGGLGSSLSDDRRQSVNYNSKRKFDEAIEYIKIYFNSFQQLSRKPD